MRPAPCDTGVAHSRCPQLTSLLTVLHDLRYAYPNRLYWNPLSLVRLNSVPTLVRPKFTFLLRPTSRWAWPLIITPLTDSRNRSQDSSIKDEAYSTHRTVLAWVDHRWRRVTGKPALAPLPELSPPSGKDSIGQDIPYVNK